MATNLFPAFSPSRESGPLNVLLEVMLTEGISLYICLRATMRVVCKTPPESPFVCGNI